MSWRPEEGWPEIVEALMEKPRQERGVNYRWGFKAGIEAGADALLEETLPLLRQVYAQLCSYRMREATVSWRTTLDDSIARLKEILGIPDEEEKGC